jgi:PAS domain S-box-containing protein
MDFSEHKRAEEQLAYSERFLRSIVQNEPECVKLLDTDGTVIDMNPAGLAMLEAESPEQVIGKSLFPLIDPEHHEVLIALSKKVCRGEKCVAEFKVLGLKGTPRWLETHSVPFEDTRSGRTLILSVTRDITEKKRSEERLRKAKADLEVRNEELLKLDRIKDGLLRDVSHELKTPVAKHLMQLEILRPILQGHRLTEAEMKAFKVMEESIRRQESVIRNLLDLARLEGGERRYRREEVSLESIFSRVRDDYQYALDTYGVEFELRVPPLVVESDGEMLWHVFSNLINNAIKFRREDVPLKVVISAELSSGEVQVQVADNGIGMDGTEKEQAFQRFFQRSTATEGSGVGLAICRRIVEDIGGSIRINSEGKNQGTAVVVTIPRRNP